MQQLDQPRLLTSNELQCSLKGLKKLELDLAVKDLPLDQRKLIHGRKKLITQYRGNVNLLFHSAMANKHGDRIRFSVLLAEDYAQLLIEEANSLSQKPSSFIRDLVYKHVQYKVALESTADTILKELEHN
ncbi:putative DNA binding protein [uncultured Mediterranean phage uvMED]|nr:Protein CHD-3 [uncultured Mediterranean phage uvMED]BAQ93347.1 putative DNA binding protein [uncultured Mediterranean phage uvMED]BAR24620.1 Protein CHD-3 [uncultured Mediterranean phage uvMED]